MTLARLMLTEDVCCVISEQLRDPDLLHASALMPSCGPLCDQGLDADRMCRTAITRRRGRAR